MEISVNVPLDSDGFFRRRCQSCGREFKRHDDNDAEDHDQYFCPLCGVVAPSDEWNTDAQEAHFEAVIAPRAQQMIADMLGDAFKGNQYVKLEMGSDWDDSEVPQALHEPDDMVIVEPPCHPDEPVKVPEELAGPFHCMLCGSPFAA